PARVRRGTDPARRSRGRRFHLHRARRSARSVQSQRHRTRRRRRRALERGRVGPYRPVPQMIRQAIGALAIVALLPQPAADYRAEIEKSRRDRIAELTASDGWLAVRGLFWLHEGTNTAGSDPASDVRLPARTAKRVGVFTLANGQVTFAADSGATITAAGKPVSAFTFTRGGESTITTERVVIAAIRRGDKVGLRMWDPEHSNRTGFKGLTYFPLAPAYRFRAKFTAYEKLKPVPVPNVLGQIVTMESPGYVEFSILDRPFRLEPVYETSTHEDLFFIFKDLTSR